MEKLTVVFLIIVVLVIYYKIQTQKGMLKTIQNDIKLLTEKETLS